MEDKKELTEQILNPLFSSGVSIEAPSNDLADVASSIDTPISPENSENPNYNINITVNKDVNKKNVELQVDNILKETRDPGEIKKNSNSSSTGVNLKANTIPQRSFSQSAFSSKVENAVVQNDNFLNSSIGTAGKIVSGIAPIISSPNPISAAAISGSAAIGTSLLGDAISSPNLPSSIDNDQDFIDRRLELLERRSPEYREHLEKVENKRQNITSTGSDTLANMATVGTFIPIISSPNPISAAAISGSAAIGTSLLGDAISSAISSNTSEILDTSTSIEDSNQQSSSSTTYMVGGRYNEETGQLEGGIETDETHTRALDPSRQSEVDAIRKLRESMANGGSGVQPTGVESSNSNLPNLPSSIDNDQDFIDRRLELLERRSPEYREHLKKVENKRQNITSTDSDTLANTDSDTLAKMATVGTLIPIAASPNPISAAVSIPLTIATSLASSAISSAISSNTSKTLDTSSSNDSVVADFNKNSQEEQKEITILNKIPEGQDYVPVGEYNPKTTIDFTDNVTNRITEGQNYTPVGEYNPDNNTEFKTNTDMIPPFNGESDVADRIDSRPTPNFDKVSFDISEMKIEPRFVKSAEQALGVYTENLDNSDTTSILGSIGSIAASKAFEVGKENRFSSGIEAGISSIGGLSEVYDESSKTIIDSYQSRDNSKTAYDARLANLSREILTQTHGLTERRNSDGSLILDPETGNPIKDQIRLAPSEFKTKDHFIAAQANAAKMIDEVTSRYVEDEEKRNTLRRDLQIRMFGSEDNAKMALAAEETLVEQKFQEALSLSEGSGADLIKAKENLETVISSQTQLPTFDNMPVSPGLREYIPDIDSFSPTNINEDLPKESIKIGSAGRAETASDLISKINEKTQQGPSYESLRESPDFIGVDAYENFNRDQRSETFNRIISNKVALSEDGEGRLEELNLLKNAAERGDIEAIQNLPKIYEQIADIQLKQGDTSSFYKTLEESEKYFEMAANADPTNRELTLRHKMVQDELGKAKQDIEIFGEHSTPLWFGTDQGYVTADGEDEKIVKLGNLKNNSITSIQSEQKNITGQQSKTTLPLTGDEQIIQSSSSMTYMVGGRYNEETGQLEGGIETNEDHTRALDPSRQAEVDAIRKLRESMANGGSGVQPTGVQPTGVQSSGVQFGGIQFGGVQLTDTQAPGVQPTGVQPTGVQPTGVQSSGVQIGGVQPTGVQPTGVQSSGVQFGGIQFGGIQPTGVQFGGIQFGGVQFGGVESSGVQIGGVQLTDTQAPGVQIGGGESVTNATFNFNDTPKKTNNFPVTQEYSVITKAINSHREEETKKQFPESNNQEIASANQDYLANITREQFPESNNQAIASANQDYLANLIKNNEIVDSANQDYLANLTKNNEIVDSANQNYLTNLTREKFPESNNQAIDFLNQQYLNKIVGESSVITESSTIPNDEVTNIPDSVLPSQETREQFSPEVAKFKLDSDLYGDVDSTYNMGIAYYEGKGAEKDIAKAKEYFQKAFDMGDAGSEFYLTEIKKEMERTGTIDAPIGVETTRSSFTPLPSSTQELDEIMFPPETTVSNNKTELPTFDRLDTSAADKYLPQSSTLSAPSIAATPIGSFTSQNMTMTSISTINEDLKRNIVSIVEEIVEKQLKLNEETAKSTPVSPKQPQAMMNPPQTGPSESPTSLVDITPLNSSNINSNTMNDATSLMNIMQKISGPPIWRTTLG